MESLKSKRIRLFLLAFITIIISVFGLFQVAHALFEDRDGKPVKIDYMPKNYYKELNSGEGNLLDRTEFKLTDEGKNAVLPKVFEWEALMKTYKKCEIDKCKKYFIDKLYDTQDDFKKMGIKVHVPTKNPNKWDGQTDFMVKSKEEGSKEFGGVYKIALDETRVYIGTEYRKKHKDCGGVAQKCFDKALQDKVDEYTKAYKSQKEADAFKKDAKDAQAKIDDYQKALDSLNKTGKIPDQCADRGKDTKESCKDYLESQIKDQTKAKETAEKKAAEAQAEADKAEDKADEESKNPDYKAQKASKLVPDVYLIASDGLFTGSREVEVCSGDVKDAETGKTVSKGNIDKADESEGKVTRIFVDIIGNALIKPVVDLLFGMECPGINNGKLSLVSEVLNITSPVNITNNYIIMTLITITQSLAYVFAIGLIVFYAIMYATGYENLEPINFGIRMFFAMVAVFFLPYLMQDILNLNNVIVYYLSQITVTFDGGSQPVSVVFAGALRNFVDNITGTFLNLKNLLALVICVVMVYFALQPMIKIMLWWYSRLLKILFYAILGPLMVIMIGLPKTANFASRWLKDFIGETFSQVFMVIAMAMLAFLVGNIADFAAIANLGWLGIILVMYASILFLAETPSVASAFIGGARGVSGDQIQRGFQSSAKNLGKDLGGNAKALTRALKGDIGGAAKAMSKTTGMNKLLAGGAVLGGGLAARGAAKGADRLTGNRMSTAAKTVGGTMKDSMAAKLAEMKNNKQQRVERNLNEMDERRKNKKGGDENQTWTQMRQNSRGKKSDLDGETKFLKQNRQEMLDNQVAKEKTKDDVQVAAHKQKLADQSAREMEEQMQQRTQQKNQAETEIKRRKVDPEKLKERKRNSAQRSKEAQSKRRVAINNWQTDELRKKHNLNASEQQPKLTSPNGEKRTMLDKESKQRLKNAVSRKRQGMEQETSGSKLPYDVLEKAPNRQTLTQESREALRAKIEEKVAEQKQRNAQKEKRRREGQAKKSLNRSNRVAAKNREQTQAKLDKQNANFEARGGAPLKKEKAPNGQTRLTPESKRALEERIATLRGKANPTNEKEPTEKPKEPEGDSQGKDNGVDGDSPSSAPTENGENVNEKETIITETNEKNETTQNSSEQNLDKKKEKNHKENEKVATQPEVNLQPMNIENHSDAKPIEQVNTTNQSKTEPKGSNSENPKPENTERPKPTNKNEKVETQQVKQEPFVQTTKVENVNQTVEKSPKGETSNANVESNKSNVEKVESPTSESKERTKPNNTEKTESERTKQEPTVQTVNVEKGVQSASNESTTARVEKVEGTSSKGETVVDQVERKVEVQQGNEMHVINKETVKEIIQEPTTEKVVTEKTIENVTPTQSNVVQEEVINKVEVQGNPETVIERQEKVVENVTPSQPNVVKEEIIKEVNVTGNPETVIERQEKVVENVTPAQPNVVKEETIREVEVNGNPETIIERQEKVVENVTLSQPNVVKEEVITEVEVQGNAETITQRQETTVEKHVESEPTFVTEEVVREINVESPSETIVQQNERIVEVNTSSEPTIVTEEIVKEVNVTGDSETVIERQEKVVENVTSAQPNIVTEEVVTEVEVQGNAETITQRQETTVEKHVESEPIIVTEEKITEIEIQGASETVINQQEKIVENYIESDPMVVTEEVVTKVDKEIPSETVVNQVKKEVVEEVIVEPSAVSESGETIEVEMTTDDTPYYHQGGADEVYYKEAMEFVRETDKGKRETKEILQERFNLTDEETTKLHSKLKKSGVFEEKNAGENIIDADDVSNLSTGDTYDMNVEVKGQSRTVKGNDKLALQIARKHFKGQSGVTPEVIARKMNIDLGKATTLFRKLGKDVNKD